MKRATVSVCMIVRNEEAMLAGCLESLRTLAHEVVIVDTGSTDGTLAVAKRARTRVTQIPWQDDFAAARNASIARAHGDWILVVDADERLGPGAVEALRRALVRADFDCGMLPMHEATRVDAPLAEVVSGVARNGEPNYLPRLLRRTPDLRFEGIVHENIAGWLKARGMRVAFVEAPIVHLGAVRAVREARGKVARNVALLEKASRAHPEDPSPLGYLAHEHLEAGRFDDAREVTERGWALVEQKAPGSMTSVLRLATARSRLALDAGNHDRVLATVARAEALEGPHPDFDFFRGSAREMQGLGARTEHDRTRHLEAALAAYRAALHKHEDRYAQALVVGASSWASATRAGAVLLVLGRLEAARACFREALASKPSHRDAALGLAECRLESGEPEAALAALEPLLDERPDGWLLSAAALDALGLRDDLRLFLARARDRATRGYLSPHRRERHGTLHGALAAYLGTPISVPGRSGAIFSLLAREPLPYPEGVPYPVVLRDVARLTRNLVAAGRGELLSRLFEPRAEQVMPGLSAVVMAVLGELGLAMADDGEPTPTFVGALGTRELTTIKGLLAAHPGLTVVEDEGLATLLEGDADGASVRSWLASRGSDQRRTIVVGTTALLRLSDLARCLPAARFIHLVRDVRALVAIPDLDVLGDAGDLERRATRWSTLVHGLRAQGAALGDRYAEYRYEDLLADPQGSVRRLLAFLGEPEDERMLRHLVEAYPGRPDRWRRELGKDTRLRVEAVAREALTTLGYEVTA